jgi:hypothetical protein
VSSNAKNVVTAESKLQAELQAAAFAAAGVEGGASPH